MRLTFRTMLAYMNGLLEPEDAQEIGRKIEESEFAKNLLHRTRDVVRRLRLAAPGLSDRGSDLDPNTVAEYLDHTLPDDRVPDFEKVCLDSDVQLAEVSACHQILTLVLGEAAEIEPAARQRMYQLPTLARPQANVPIAAGPPQVEPAQATGIPDSPSAAQTPTVRPRVKPTVPDYLRDPPRKWSLLRVAVGLFFILIVSALVLAVCGQFNAGTPLGQLLGLGASTAELSDGAVPSAQETPSERKPLAEKKRNAESPEEVIRQPEAAVAEAGPMRSDTNPSPGAGNPSPTEGIVPVEPTVQPPAVQPPTALPERQPDEVRGGPPLEPIPKPVPKGGKRDSVASSEGGLESPGKAEPPAGEEDKKAGETPVKPEVAVESPQPVGRLVSDKHVLLRFAEKDRSWQRVPPQGIVLSGQQLISLPTYHPLVTFTAGTTVELRGGTQVETMPTDATGIGNLRIDYGHFRLRATGKPDTRIRLHVGTHTGVITFGDPDAVAVVEVAPVHAPGTNPETEPWSRAVRIYAESGQIAWFEEGGQAGVRVQSIGPGDGLDAFAQPPRAAAATELPKWAQSDALGTFDALASPVIEQAIDPGHPADQTLLDLTAHRRREVRRLAIQSAGYLGEFAAAVAVLNDADYRLEWADYVEKLAEAIARDSQTATAVGRAFEKQYGQEGAGLYRMLWGYTEKGLRAGEAEPLVEQLDHKALAYRVLSFWNLKEITGWGLNYRPEDTPLKRQTPLKTWRQRLRSGEIWTRLSADRRETDRGGTKSAAPAEL